MTLLVFVLISQGPAPVSLLSLQFLVWAVNFFFFFYFKKFSHSWEWLVTLHYVVFICIFLVTNTVRWLFRCYWQFTWPLRVKCLLVPLPVFLLGCLPFSYWYVRVLYLFWVRVPLEYYKYFLLLCSFPLISYWYLWWTENEHFIAVHFLTFSLCDLCCFVSYLRSWTILRSWRCSSMLSPSSLLFYFIYLFYFILVFIF